jgi:hypothetical protein
MSRTALARGGAVLALTALLFVTASAAPVERLAAPKENPKPAPRVTPKFEAVAETSLLMDGLNQSNYRGLEKLLKKKPDDAETWQFVRGQALIIAETGNLLLLRPPRNSGQDAWFTHAMGLRDAAADLARKASDRDYDGSQTALLNVAEACNKCHTTFREPTRIGPDAGRKVGRDAE